jgi:hypothetical protein
VHIAIPGSQAAYIVAAKLYLPHSPVMVIFLALLSALKIMFTTFFHFYTIQSIMKRNILKN